VVGLDNRLGDGQPDAASGSVGGAGGVAPVEAFEQLGGHGGVEPFTGVGHHDPASMVVSGGGDGDGACCGRVSQGVVQQRPQRLGQPLGVGQYLPGGAAVVDAEADPLGVEPRPVRCHGAGDHVLERDQDRVQVQVQLTFLRSRYRGQVADESVQPL
jgi:hypothetical protein